MPVELKDLTPEQLAELTAQVRANVLAELAPQKSETPEAAFLRIKEQLKLETVPDVADLKQAREAMLAQMQTALKGEYDRMQASAGQMLASMMAEIKHQQHVADLAQNLTAGSEKAPRGIPVTTAEMEKFLSSLDGKQVLEAERILNLTVEKGLTDFAELGHGHEVEGKKALPEDIAARLTSKELTIADLSSPVMAPILGDLKQYDLTQWKEGK